MANEIEIRVTSKDDSGSGFTSAAKKVDGLKSSASELGKASDTASKKVHGLDTALDQAAKSSQTTEKSASKLGSTLGDVGKIAGGVLAANLMQAGASKAIDLFRSTTEAASNLGESLNAVDKTFGSASGEIEKFGLIAAKNAGLSQRAFNELAVPLGAMLKNSGLNLGVVSAETTKLTQRAADMASVFNTDVSSALEAIQAGLRGEADPLERFGVGLSAAAVEQRALADSGKKSAAELSNQEKMLARLALIYDQTSSAAGDFADTSDGLANSQRIATAQIEDAKAKIGASFLPVMADAARVSGNLAETLTSLPGPAQAVIAGIGGLGAAALILAPRISSTKDALDKMRASDSGLQRGIGKSTVAFTKYAGTLGAIALGAQVLGEITGTQLNPQVDALTVGLTEWARSGKLAGESARILGDNGQNLADIFGDMNSGAFWTGFTKALEGFTHTGDSFDDSTKKIEERITAIDSALAGLVSAGKGDQAAEIFQKLADQATAVGLPIDKLKSALPSYAAAMEVAGKKTDTLGNKAGEAASSVDELNASFHKLIDGAFSLEEAQDKAADAVARLVDQVKQQRDAHEKGAASLDHNTQAGRDNADAVRNLVGDYGDLMTANQKAGVSNAGLSRKLEDQLVAMGFARDEAHRYVGQLDLLKQKLDAIPTVTTKTVNVRVNETSGTTYGGIGRIQDRATGGVSSAATGGARSGLVRMNEQGGELVRLPNGSMVYPHGQSQRMLDQGLNFGGGGSGGNGGPIVIELQFDDSSWLKGARGVIKDNGGNVQVVLGRKQ